MYPDLIPKLDYGRYSYDSESWTSTSRSILLNTSINICTDTYTIQMWTNMYQQVTEDPTHTCTDTIRLVNYRKEPLPFSLCSPAPPSQPDRVPVGAPERQPPTIPALRTPDPRRTIPQAWVHGEWIENAKHKYTRHCSKPSSPRQH